MWGLRVWRVRLRAKDDHLFGAAGDDSLHGGAGDDSLGGRGGVDHLYGGDGVDTLKGGAGDDVLYGGAGADKLSGDGGADHMEGGAGNDVYTVDNSGDVVVELANGGADRVNATVSFTLSANVEDLTLTGGGAIDGSGNGLANKISGNASANSLTGLAGNDVLDGNGGDDVLVGGDGKDVLTGGGGADHFVFGAAKASTTDRIADFAAGDHLVFTGSDYGLSTGALDDDHFRLSTEAAPHHGEFVYDETRHVLTWDPDGSGRAAGIAVASFSNGYHLAAGDFLII